MELKETLDESISGGLGYEIPGTSLTIGEGLAIGAAIGIGIWFVRTSFRNLLKSNKTP